MLRVFWVLLKNRKGDKMEKLIPVGLIVLLLGALILVWAKSLNRRKLISNGQETSNSVVGTIFVVIGAAMMAIPFFVDK